MFDLLLHTIDQLPDLKNCAKSIIDLFTELPTYVIYNYKGYPHHLIGYIVNKLPKDLDLEKENISYI